MLEKGGEKSPKSMDEQNNQSTEVNEIPSQTTQSTQEPASQQQEVAPLQSDFPEDPEKQRQAFYEMRKKLEKYENSTPQVVEQPTDDMDFINIARGTTNEQPYQPNQFQTQNVEFDQSDPATQAFLSQAQQAQAAAQNAQHAAAKAQAQLEDFEAWQKFPQLNPKSPNRDNFFAKDVQKEYITAKLEATAKGKPHPRLVDVAEQVTKHYEEIRNQAAQQAAAQERQVIAQKEAASLESQGTRVSLQESADDNRIEQLRDRVRRGDINALTELNKIQDPYIQTIPDDAAF